MFANYNMLHYHSVSLSGIDKKNHKV